MATSIFFLGRTIATPGSYSQIDASGLEQVGLGAAGVVAILGEAEGGRPASSMTRPSEFISLTSPSRVRQAFRSGDLREAAAMLFEPSRDPAIPGGAAQIIAMKTNEALQSSATLANVDGPALDLVSRDYGAFTNQIFVTVDPATSPLTGFRIVITFEDQVEVGDGLGGDAIAELAYTTSLNTFDTVTVDVLPSGAIRASGELVMTGLDTDASNAWSGTPIIAQVTATAADVGKTITLYGTLTGGAQTTEMLTLINGTANGTVVFEDVVGAILNEAADGVIAVADGTNDRFNFVATEKSKGVIDLRAGYVNNTTFNLDYSVAGPVDVLVWGRSAAGAVVSETIAATNANPASTIEPKQIEVISLVNVPAANNVTLTAVVAQTDPAVQTTLLKAKDYFDALTDLDIDDATVVGFSWNNISGSTARSVLELDELSGLIAGNHPTAGLSAEFTATFYDILNWINLNSQLISAEVASGATRKAPLALASPLYLTGGAEGVSTISSYQNALNLLKQIRVNTIVVLSGNSAVQQALEAHCAYMCGIGRNERDGLVGIVKVDTNGVPIVPLTLPTKAEYLEQTAALGSRHIRATGQAITRFDTVGDRTEFAPYFAACIGAGMQAGSSIGTSLTHKYANVLDVRQDTSWSPTEDSEELIQGGAFVLTEVPGVGFRWVRNVTTYLISNNLAFTEASVNEAVNFSVYEFRTSLEAGVGRAGNATTLGSLRGIAVTKLGLLVDEGVLTGYRSLTFELAADVLEVAVEIAPIIPINFVRSTIHLVTTQQTA